MQLSAPDLATIRSKPQSSRLSLNVFTPQVIFAAQINNPAAAFGDRYVYYDHVTGGSYSYIEDGMTMLVGSTPGAQDYGKIRCRFPATAAWVSVSENSNIPWTDNLYITVLKYWEVWPIYPRIIQDPSDSTKVIFYKDYDIAYSTQNSVLGSFVCAGPHRSVFVGDNIYWSAAGTSNVKGDGLTYSWTFEVGPGLTYVYSSAQVPGNINYPVVGDFVTKLEVTNASGGVDVTYRYVCVRDRIGAGNYPPIQRWSMSPLTGSRGEGAYSTTITVYDQIQINDNAVIIISSDNWYGNTHASLGGNSVGAENIFFVGYVEKDSIKHDYQKNFIEFNVFSITGLMKQVVGFSVSTQTDHSPDTWYKILDLNIERALYHYLYWHTTVLKVADFHFVGTDPPIQYFDADRTSMFDAVDNLMRGTLHGSVSSDRQGAIYAEVDPMAYPNPLGSFPYVMDISKTDWMNMPVIQERQSDEYSYLEYGGIQYNGAGTGTFSAFMACAPGNAPSFRGKIENLEGFALSSQVQLNQMIGCVLANKNAKYPTIDMDMTENLMNLDIAPQETVQITVNPEDTPKNIIINGVYIPTDFTWNYDAENGILVPTITFAALVDGWPGTTIPIPTTPPTDNATTSSSNSSSPSSNTGVGSNYTAIADYAYVNLDNSSAEQAAEGIQIKTFVSTSSSAAVQFKVNLPGTFIVGGSAGGFAGTQFDFTIICASHPIIASQGSFGGMSGSQVVHLNGGDIVDIDVLAHASPPVLITFSAYIVKVSS